MESGRFSILVSCYASSTPDSFVELKQLVDCFSDVFTSPALLASVVGLPKHHLNYLFKEYSWEIFDKICYFGMTMPSTSPVMNYMFQMLSVIAGRFYFQSSIPCDNC